jgi:hypothetical protein
MMRIRKRALIGSALLPAALMLSVCAASPAVAGESASPTRAVATAPAPYPLQYTMQLSSTSATVRPGGTTKTVLSFTASRRLYGARVDLSVSGLPAGATASFSPTRPRVGGHSTLTISTAQGSPAGASTVTVGAIINLFGADPIGTSTPFNLTVSAP